MKHFLVYTVSYLSLANICYAQTCNPLPSCADLGYTTTAEEAATKSKCLPCPLDNNYYYCPDLCWEYTLTSCEGSSCKKCDYGDLYRIEVTAPLCEYTETTPPTGCLEAESCIREGTTYYSTNCKTCKGSGYTLTSGQCVANSCSGYPSTSSSISGCKTVSSTTCMSGDTKKYKCSTCNSGYQLSGGSCINCSSGGVGLRSTPYTDEECERLYGSGYSASISCSCYYGDYYYCTTSNEICI